MVNNQFKTGDRVKCILTDRYDLTYGKVYEVLNVDKESVQIQDDKELYWHNIDSFELAMDKFKVGDKARALKQINFSDNTSHKEGEIIKVTELNVCYFNNHNNCDKYSIIEPEIIKRGQRYKVNYNVQEFIVAQVSVDEYCLIGLSDGNRWADPTPDINKIFGYLGRESFELIK